jgi:hypothetical protein
MSPIESRVRIAAIALLYACLAATSSACSTSRPRGRLIYADIPYLPSQHPCVVWDVVIVSPTDQIIWHAPDRPCTSQEDKRNHALANDTWTP